MLHCFLLSLQKRPKPDSDIFQRWVECGKRVAGVAWPVARGRVSAPWCAVCGCSDCGDRCAIDVQPLCSAQPSSRHLLLTGIRL